MKKSKIKIECSSCGKITPHSDRGRATETEIIDFDSQNGETIRDVIEWQHIFLQCEVCEHVSLQVVSDWEDQPIQLYPPIKDLSGVPATIKQSYVEAKKVKDVSPVAFSVLIRKSLEYICEDKRASGRDLKSKLEDLGKRGIIPATLSRMTQAIRYFGNLGAHATYSKIGREESSLMDDFFLAVAEYVYIAPEKIKKAEERAKKTVNHKI